MTSPQRARDETATDTLTLNVRIEGRDGFFDRIEDDIERIEADGEVSIRGLSLPDEAALARVFSEHNLELIRAIAEHEPASMRALADWVDRDIKNVSRNLHELSALGLVDLVEAGRAKRPVVPYDEIELVYPLRGGDESGADPTTAQD